MSKNVDPKKAPKAFGAKAKLKDNPATRAVNKVFTKIGEKTGVNQKKVDEWQAKWLAVPKNRTKYENLKNAPAVVGEEFFAITNDIIDFVQGEHGSQSHIFSKLREKAGQIKKKAMEVKAAAEKKAAEVKKAAGKGATKAGGGDFVSGLVAKAKAGIAQAKERAQKGMAEAKKRVEAKAAEAKKMAEKTKKIAKK